MKTLPHSTISKAACFAIAILLSVSSSFAQITWYQDLDNDTWGDPSATQSSTTKPSGYVQNNLDCDDGVAQGTTWANIGTPGFSTGVVSFTSLVIDGTGTPYVAYRDLANGSRVTVMKYDGANWVTVGTDGFSAGSAEYVSLAIDGSGTPYVAYRDNGNSNKATVMKYNGTNWVTVGSAGLSSASVSYTSLAIDASGTPYIAYRDNASSQKATVMKYNGTSWVIVGAAGFSAGGVNLTSLAIDGSGVPYLAYMDYANSQKATVMKFDGTNWTTVGSAGFSAGIANYVSLAIDGSGTPYVAYSDDANADKATVMKYNGTSWAPVGSAGFSAGSAIYTSLAIDKAGTPFIAYADNASSDKATVMKYNGSNWVAVGNTGFSAGAAGYTSIAMDALGIPHVAYLDAGNGSEAVVRKIAPLLPVPTLTLTANPGNTVASGTSVTFTANSPTAASAVYQWYRNDVAVGTNSSTYTTSTYDNGDVITCEVTSTCGSQSYDVVMSTTMHVIPAVALSASCYCASVLCTLTVTSSVNPSYILWKDNGTTVQTVYATWNTNATTVAGGNGAGSAANQLDNPFGISVDPEGNTYVMDVVNVRVQKWAPSATSGTTVAGGNGTGTGANQFSQPLGIFADALGNVYVADAGNNRVQKWAPGATTGVTVAGGNGAGAAANQLNSPYDVFVDNAGNVYICDNNNDRVQKWAPGATAGVTVAGGNGAGSAANQLNDPTGIWVDQSGNVYVADNSNHRIQKWVPSATTGVTVAGGNGQGTGLNQLNFPADVYVDGAGLIYVGDNANNRVVRWVPGATAGVLVAGTGTSGTGADQLNIIGSLVGNADGSLYVSDRGNNRVQQFTTNTSMKYVPAATGNFTATPVTFENTSATTSAVGFSAPTTPSVSITTNTGSTTVCQGVSVIFNAAATNGGTNPLYQWRVNGAVVSNAANFSSSSLPGGLVNGDVIDVMMYPNTCSVPDSIGDTVTMTVNPPVPPTSATISANPGNTICSGVAVTFTASTTGAGTAPSYQWLVNGNNAGTNSSTFTTSTLNHLDVVSCVVKSDFACPASLTSNTITMNVTPTVTPTVTITTNTGASACQGTSVTFLATPTSSGANPTFVWKVNGNIVGSNANAYTTSSLAPGNHTVTCEMTSTASCITTNIVTGTYNILINPTTTPTIAISSPQAVNGNVCAGSNVTFTANITGGGASPSYQWKLNGVNVGSNSATYNAGTGLVAGDAITCELTSNYPCLAANNVISNTVTITIYQNTTASVVINSSVPPNEACLGIPITFTAVPANGGTSPSYQWFKDGNPIAGATTDTYIDPSLTGGTIKCEMTTSQPCATPAVATQSVNLVINTIGSASIDIYVTPDSVGCEGQGFVFHTYYTNGGNNPQYQWFINGQAVAGATLGTFQSSSLMNGDVINCELASNAVCVFPVTSDGISMELFPSPTPSADIYGIPKGQDITFYSTVTDAGTNPQYQWLKNNIPITGATTATYTLFNHAPTDKITLQVESSDVCANPKFVLSNTLTIFQVTDVMTVSGAISDLQLFPNPNEGKFHIKGNLLAGGEREAVIEVLNALGQVVYKDVVKINNNNLDAQVDIAGKAAGMYTVRVQVDGQTQNMRFVLK